MGTYEINWAVGGRQVVEAESPEAARLDAQELLPSGADWQDVDVIAIEEKSKTALT